jgi:hypothetical protein
MASSTPAIITYVLCGTMALVAILNYAILIPKADGQSAKIMTVVAAFSISACALAYFLALWHFSTSPDQMLHFLLAIVMFVALPMSLISAAISTVSISNLQDVLAAGA